MTTLNHEATVKVMVVDEATLAAASVAAQLKMDKARTRLLMKREFRFFAALALHLQPVPVPGLGTMATDGDNLYYDPLLVAGDHWSLDELIGVNAHEALHCAMLHHARRGDRDLPRWNVACDRAINGPLLKAGFVLPKGRLYEPGDEAHAAEYIYERLPQQPSQGGGSDKGDDEDQPGNYGDCGAVVDLAKQPNDGNGAADAKAEQVRKWTIIARQAAAIAQAQGLLPGGFEGLLDPLKSPIDPWAVLRQFVDMCRADDYSWSRPNRRHVGEGLYLPSLWSEGVGECLIAVDTSGSVSDKQLAHALGFVAAVLADVRPSKTHFVQVDARVHGHQTYGPGDELPTRVKVTGRGGTSMAPIWDYAQKHDLNPTVAVVLTDMEMSSSDFGPAQGFPTLWLNVGRHEAARAPWGDTVYAELP